MWGVTESPVPSAEPEVPRSATSISGYIQISQQLLSSFPMLCPWCGGSLTVGRSHRCPGISARDESCPGAVFKHGSAGNPSCAHCGYPISIIDQAEDGGPVWAHRWENR